MYEKQIDHFLQLRARKLEMSRNNESGEDQEHPFEARTYLYIRAFDGDTGSRPVPQGSTFWLSPDIEVFDPASGQYVPESTLVPGHAYRVDVTVNNGGDLSASACNVDLFVTDFTVGALNPPRVGPPQLLSVPPRGKAVASFDYTPDTAGHRCLFARVWSLVSMDYPGCENADRRLITQVVDYSVTMRQIGQQNLSVVQQGASLEVVLAAGTLPGGRGHLIVQAAGTLPVRIKRQFRALRFAALTAQRAQALDGVRISRLEPSVVVRPPVLEPPIVKPPVIKSPQVSSRLMVQPLKDLPPLGKLTAASRAKLRNWRLDGAGAAIEKLRLDVPQLGLTPVRILTQYRHPL